MQALLTCTLSLALAVVVCAGAADLDPIRENIDQAKATFDEDMAKYNAAAEAYFAKRERAARDAGNRKLVDQIKVEQKAFAEWGDLPKTGTLELKRIAADAQRVVTTAFRASVKEFVKEKKDKEADGAEKELIAVLVKAHRAAYAADLKPAHTTTIEGWAVEKRKIAINDREFPNAILMHARTNTFSDAEYGLNSGYGLIRGLIVVARPNGVQGKGPQTAVWFEIKDVGKKKNLWVSKRVPNYDDPQDFAINISSVDVLNLSVHCPGTHEYCHSHWLDALLIR